MKVPCCSVCQTRFNKEERVPLLLQCGHGFCRECLSLMFAASIDDSPLACPRCRQCHKSVVVGNSVQALRKNYPILTLINSNSSAKFDVDFTVDEEGEDTQHRRGSQASSSGCGSVMELGAHPELKLVRKIGEGRRSDVKVWAAETGGRVRCCNHRVAVKKVAIGEDSGACVL